MLGEQFTPMERARRFAGFLLLVALPLITPALFVDRLLGEREVAGGRALEERLEQDLTLMRLAVQPREIFCRAFARLFRFLSRQGFTAAGVRRAPRFFPPGLPVQVSVFTSDGGASNPRWTAPTPKFVVGRLWNSILQGREEPRMNSMFRALLGPRFLIRNVATKEGLPFPIGTGGGEGFLTWRRSGAGGGVIAFVPQKPSTFGLLRFSLRSLPADGFWAACHPVSHRVLRRGAQPTGWREALAAGMLRGGGTFLGGGHLFRIDHHPDGFWVLRGLPCAHLDHGGVRKAIWVAVLLLLLFLFRAWYSTRISLLEQVPLTPRLAVLFALAALFPALLLLGLGISSFQEQGLVLERQVFDRDLERLRNIDLDYQRTLSGRLARDRFLRDSPIIRGGDRARVSRIAGRLFRKAYLTRFETRMITGEFLGRVLEIEKETLFLTTLFAKEVLRRYLRASIVYDDAATETFGRNILLSPLTGFNGVFDRPDTLIPMDFALQKNIWYWDAVPPAPGLPMAYFFVIHHISEIREEFLRERLPERVVVFDADLRSWFPRQPASSVFPPMVAEARTAGKVIRRPFTHGGMPYLATAWPSIRLPGLVFATASPLASIRQEVDRMRRALFAVVLILLVMAGAYASLMAASLIVPIRELARGVHALETRDFAHRLPPLGRDEFGDLGNTFNHIIHEMEGLDVAREVQRNLLPVSLPRIPGYELHLFSQSATDLGGDYGDLIPGPDGRLMLITGDVTGHGISSALVATMAKTVGHLCVRDGRSVVEFLQRLNGILAQVFHRKKLMTMVVGLLTPAEHRLEWSCVGHPFPILRRGNGTIVSLKMVSYPLGTRKNPVIVTESLPLEPGDLLLFYTDGAVEAQGPRGAPFGFDGLERFMAAASPDRPLDLLAGDLRDTLQAHAQGEKWVDDVTLLLLKRLPS